MEEEEEEMEEKEEEMEEEEKEMEEEDDGGNGVTEFKSSISLVLIFGQDIYIGTRNTINARSNKLTEQLIKWWPTTESSALIEFLAPQKGI